MNRKLEEILITRAERFRDSISKRILSRSIPLKAHYWNCGQPVSFDKRLDGEYQFIAEGTKWGEAWESAWFRLSGEVPEEWKGCKISAHLDFSGEGLVFNSSGEILQGITNGSVFDNEFSRDIVPVREACDGGEEIELWVETAANGLFGVYTHADPDPDVPNRYGHFDASVNSIKLCVFDESLWHLWLDLQILIGFIHTLPEKSVRRARIIQSLSDAIDVYADTRSNLDSCRAILDTELNKPATPSDLKVTAVGHAHIDTAWLWPVRETIRKCARTFASQLALIDKYPNYVFGASQPQHYAFVKEYYPDLYVKIKKAVEEGRWELQGGMWVEADCNVISGESMIRQILHGKNFFMDEFGADVNNLWLPDVFGYSPALPQILKKSGIDYFLTQKMSWNQFNEMPHHTFIWQGIDGSELLTHFPPENNYNSQLGTKFLVPAQEHFKEKAYIDEFISLFGVGDGGGGPKEENIELGLRMADLESSPRVSFGTAHEFFNRLEKYRDQLPKWVGELYLELHRGTLTSQALVKKSNRLLENKLKSIEWLYSLLPIEDYPQEQIDSIWKTVLINQFHDIIPGSSINAVYKVTHAEYDEAAKACDSLLEKFAQQYFNEDEDSLILINIHGHVFKDVIELPESWHGVEVVDDGNNPIPVQNEGAISTALVSVPAFSILSLRKNNNSVSEEGTGSLTLENSLIRYEFSTNGQLINAFDKECHKQVISEMHPGNVLTLYDDHPNNWDAWDIDIYYEKAKVETFSSETCKPLASGRVRQGLYFEGRIGKSTLVQHAYLANNSKRLDFQMEIDWREKHRMLRTAFPVSVNSDFASFDIQYGFVNRATHRNTSWDMARFEVVGHKYADLSDNDYGVALLNDCKYGYKILGHTIDMNLLRSPNHPDPDADMGKHEFTYSFYPHSGDLIHSDVQAQAMQLNQKLLVFENTMYRNSILPIRVQGNGLSLEVVKKAEKEDCLVVRIVETFGCHSSGKLLLEAKASEIIETELMEWSDGTVYTSVSEINLSLTPFEIKTFKVKR